MQYNIAIGNPKGKVSSQFTQSINTIAYRAICTPMATVYQRNRNSNMLRGKASRKVPRVWEARQPGQIGAQTIQRGRYIRSEASTRIHWVYSIFTATSANGYGDGWDTKQDCSLIQHIHIIRRKSIITQDFTAEDPGSRGLTPRGFQCGLTSHLGKAYAITRLDLGWPAP